MGYSVGNLTIEVVIGKINCVKLLELPYLRGDWTCDIIVL